MTAPVVLVATAAVPLVVTVAVVVVVVVVEEAPYQAVHLQVLRVVVTTAVLVSGPHG